MNETLLVKHAIGGRTFIDSSKQVVNYVVEQAGSGWAFTIHTPLSPQIEELIKWKEELNVFLFQHFDDGQPVKKLWFYVEGSSVKYDHSLPGLGFTAKSSIAYIPQQFGYTL